MKKARITALLTSAVILLTGCDYGQFESYVLPTGNTSVSDERNEESDLLGVKEKPSSIIDMSSQELVSSIRIGWNLGNTLDACVTDRDGAADGIPEGAAEIDETLWGNPYATRELFKALTDDGFNAVRIPITWCDHVDENGKISSVWMNRVQQVVDYAYSCGMYVIIGMYHDGGTDEEYGAWLGNAVRDKEGTLERYRRLWEQIAAQFKNYNERLIFESMNEVAFEGQSDNAAYRMLNSFNQEFVDTVRASGGNNSMRHLLIAGYMTDIAKTCDERFIMPNDPAKKCIVSVHYYTPWEFCRTDLQSEWGTRSEEREMENLVAALKETFTDHGVPVIIGEFAARGSDEASRIFFCEKLVKLCRDSGIACFLWDGGELVDRETYEWRSEELLNALIRASYDDYTPVKKPEESGEE